MLKSVWERRVLSRVAIFALLAGVGVARLSAQTDPPQPAASGSIDQVLDLARAQSNEADFLHPDEAFQFSASADGPDRVRLNWQIAEGYYLYRSRTTARTASREVQLGQLAMPAGKPKTDEYFGEQEVYYHELTATVSVARPGSQALELPLAVTYQGCAEAGLCYPPEPRLFRCSCHLVLGRVDLFRSRINSPT